MKISYNWLKWYVPDVLEAEKLADVFTYHLCEVESVEKTEDGDTIFDLNILPNRAHDLLSHQGIAKELSGQLGIKYIGPTPKYEIPESKPTELTVEIQSNKCRRYSSRIVRNVKVGPSPEWVVKHLESIGQKSINNVVDATNLCMYDSGQPMHAFDLDKLFSQKIIIRDGLVGEKMTTLSDVTVEIKDGDLVIAEESGSVLALAGVKGGVHAQVDEHTTNIVLEVANFEPSSIRKTARRLNILTDSAKRFENDLSTEHASFGMIQISGLIKEIFPEAIFEEIVDIYSEKQTSRKIEFDLGYLQKVLGEKISIEQIITTLNNYGFSYTNEGNNFALDVPYLRLDLVGKHDIAEEIGRIIGYDNVSPKLPEISFTPSENEINKKINIARQKLLNDGYSEVITYAFTKKGMVEVARGAKGKEFLRPALMSGLKDAYELNRLNLPLLDLTETKIFEIGSVFTDIGHEEIHVAYADKKGVKEFSLTDFTKELDLLPTSNFQHSAHNKPFVSWSHFPFITRDISVWVKEGINPNLLIEICKENAGELLVREPSVFDTFTKDGRTSIAIRMVFQSYDRTLTDDEVSQKMDKILSRFKQEGFEVR